MFSRLLRHFLLILPELGRCHRTGVNKASDYSKVNLTNKKKNKYIKNKMGSTTD